MTSSRLESLRAMVEADPKNPLTRYGLANELVNAESYEEAVSALLQYLAMNDDEGSAYRLLGFASEKLGRYEDAREAYRKGIEAANRHRHPGMAGEFEEKLQDLEGL